MVATWRKSVKDLCIVKRKFVVMRTFRLLLLFAAFGLAACKADPVIHRVLPPERPEEQQIPEDAGEKLTACSFNIRYYNTTDEYPWSVRKEPVMKFIMDVKPDFVGFQEVRSSQSQDIAYLLGEEYSYYDINRDTGTAISTSSGEGVGVLYKKSRFTLEDKGFFWLAEDPDKLPEKNDDGTFSSWHSACRRVVVWTKLKDKWNSDRTVYFFASHFDHVSSDARLKSSELAIKKIKEITGISDLSKSGTPVFLVADFNCKYESSELAPLRTGMKDARSTADKTDNGRTFNGFGETSNSIIDHIFYSGPIKAEEYDVVTDDYGVKYISDHYPILLHATYAE